jgi:hypothetical protein
VEIGKSYVDSQKEFDRTENTSMKLIQEQQLIEVQQIY